LVARGGAAVGSPPATPKAPAATPSLPAASQTPSSAASIESLVDRARPSVVVITVTGRDGKQQALGSGFVVDTAGLVATNLHVIGEARPIQVQTFDGKTHAVTAVHASDRTADLAVLRIEAAGLAALPLADSDTLKQGQSVVAIGNPLGLRHSVVSGVVSARREIEGRRMIQLAIPVEQGNSGGPVLDYDGRVHGMLTMKSLASENLGFAVEINALRPLLARPNPIPIDRWLTIGALDPKTWQPMFGARWRQRAGRIAVDGAGQGFGGRSLCLSRAKTPDAPYEMAVCVRLDDESGAAGLVFCSDGAQKHYGFYPSGGRLRLSRFEGPDVFSWHVLEEVDTRHYHAGQWNTIKVRLEKDKIICSVNGQVVIESADRALSAGKLGLAKFRDTKAEFKQLRMGQRVDSPAADSGHRQTLDREIDRLVAADVGAGRPAAPSAALLKDAAAGAAALRDHARRLDEQAARLRQLADAVHVRRVCDELATRSKVDDDRIDLVRAALLVAQLDNEDVDVEAYCSEVDRMAGEISAKLPKGADDMARLAAVDRYLFAENGFHGSRTEYYHRSNSYLNEVLDDREGLPITLSILYIELSRRLGVSVEGVGLPSHFVVRHLPAKGQPRLIDVFEGAKPLSRDDAAKLVLANAGVPLEEEHLKSTGKRAILLRLLWNLLDLAERDKDGAAMLRYLDAVVAIAPDQSGPQRWMRAVLRYQAGRHDESAADAAWLLEHKPPGVDLRGVEELQRQIERSAVNGK
jgi:S1-C subfamily serine protease/regulator of sirC expression with transglutaminase-like and TPR domain